MSKYTLAKELHTSRSQVDRLLDPSHVGVTIGTITRAARMLGKRIRVEIVDAKRKHSHHLPVGAAAKPRSNRYAKAAAAGAD